MPITTFFALLLLIALYIALRLADRKPDKNYQRLINRTGKHLADELIKTTKKRYPRRSAPWVIKKVLADLDKGKI